MHATLAIPLRRAGLRSLRFLPLTLIAGVHGFALAAPYLAVCLGLASLARRR